MAPAFPLSDAFLTFAMISVAFMVLYPPLLGWFVHRRLGVSWRYFGYGALIFFVSQMLIRIPLVQALSFVVAPFAAGSFGLRIAWGLVLALTAGLFEEVGRYLGFRWLLRREEKTRDKAVMLGVGHGGIESMVLVAGLAAAQVLTVSSITQAQLDALPVAQRDQVVQQFAPLANAPAWTVLLGAWERLWTLPLQVAFSVVMLQAFRRNSTRWLWYAVLAHGVVDFVAPVVVPALGLPYLPTVLVSEIVITLLGVTALWVIWRLRDEPTVTV